MPGAQCRVIWMGCYDYVVQMMGFERRGLVKNCIIARIFSRSDDFSEDFPRVFIR